MNHIDRAPWATFAVSAGLVLAAVAAACGGDDDDGTEGSTAPLAEQSSPVTGASGAPTTESPASSTGGSGSSPSGSAAEIDPELVAAAEAEGQVTVYSFTSRIAEVEPVFEAAYPGIDLIGVDISATEQIERIKAEVDAGNAGADVAYIADAPVVLTDLVEGGYLEQYVPVTTADALADEYKSPLAAHRLSTRW